jgi:hypothetical protein
MLTALKSLGAFAEKPSIRACQSIDASGEDFRLVLGQRGLNGPFLLISFLAVIFECCHSVLFIRRDSRPSRELWTDAASEKLRSSELGR